MPQVEIVIGGRSFEVACQAGEESYLQSAAAMLNIEAEHLSSQIGRMPEARMLLMAGLMLADKTAGLEDKVKQADAKMAELQAEIDALQARGVAKAEMPADVLENLAELAAQAEAVAAQVEAKG